MATQSPLINRSTIKIIVYSIIGFALIMLALWVVRIAKNTLSKGKGTTGGNGSNTTNSDGTLQVPSTVDMSYIERIAQMIWSIQQDEDFGGYSGDRCEVSNNVKSMRPDELTALSLYMQQQYQMRLGAAIGRWNGDGCIPFLAGDIAEIKAKVRNL